MAQGGWRRVHEARSEVLLAFGRIERLDGRWSNVAVECRSGCCWITLDGDSADYVLLAGQRREWTDVRGPIIVMGASAEDARVHLVARPRVSRWARLLRSLAVLFPILSSGCDASSFASHAAETRSRCSSDIAIGTRGDIYVSDPEYPRIKRIDGAGTISTIELSGPGRQGLGGIAVLHDDVLLAVGARSGELAVISLEEGGVIPLVMDRPLRWSCGIVIDPRSDGRSVVAYVSGSTGQEIETVDIDYELGSATVRN